MRVNFCKYHTAVFWRNIFQKQHCSALNILQVIFTKFLKSNFIPWFSSGSAEVTFSTSSCLSSCCVLSDWLVKGPILINKGSGSETDDAFLLGVVNHFMIVVSGKSFGSTIFRQQSSYLGIADLQKNEIIFLLLSKIGFSCVDVFENVIFDFKNVKNSTFTKTNKGILEMPLAQNWQIVWIILFMRSRWVFSAKFKNS